MTENNEKPNTFAQMSESNNDQPKVQEERNVPAEVSIDDFSKDPVGERKKYNRPDLEGKNDVIVKYQVFQPDTSIEPKKSQSGNSAYWTVTQLLTYESQNADGMNNREYISGARCFQNKDGSASAINFWFEGGETQSCMLWEEVAKVKGINPKELSPREFVAFLNNRPKVQIEGRAFKNYNAEPGAPKTIKKNWPAFVS